MATETPPATQAEPTRDRELRDLSDRLGRWVAHGLLTPEQARRIADLEAGPSRPAPASPARASVVAEALGYLGAVLAVVAVSLITARYWSQLAAPGRLAVGLGAAVLLVVAGALVVPRHGRVAFRVRAVTWAASVAALGLAVWVVGRDVLHWSRDEPVVLLTGLGAAALAAVLWRSHPTTVQLAALLAPLVMAAGAAASELPATSGAQVGLAVCGTGAVWSALAWGGLLRPRRPALVLGSVVVLGGAVTTVSDDRDWGFVLALAVVAAVVVLGLLLREPGVLVVAAAGALVVVPAATTHFFPGRLAAPVALLVVGVVLVLAAVRAARRRTHGRAVAGVRAAGRPWVAVALAVLLGAAATVATLLVGRGVLG